MLETLQSEALASLFKYLVPEMILAVVACVLFLGGTFRASRDIWSAVALLGLGGALLALAFAPKAVSLGEAQTAVPFLFDPLANWTRCLAFASGLIFVLFSWNEVPEAYVAEHHACLLTIIGGTGLVGASHDLIGLFLALELVSIPTYIMLYLPKHDDASQEASMKYFMLSVFSSALLLFGFSYLYGVTGSTNLSAIFRELGLASSDEILGVQGLTLVAMLMIVAGLGFRITAVPFHFYAPDVYQGTSTVGAAFLAYIPKIAGFVAMIRVFGYVVPEGVVAPGGVVGKFVSEQVPILLWFLAAFTMTLGNLLAILQDNVKRLLAYSGVAHSGYMLVALATAPNVVEADGGNGSLAAVLYYLVAYGCMTVGVFLVISMLDRPERSVDTVEDFAGLSRTHPGLALMVAILLFSLIGIPLTAGFTGKFLVFFNTLFVAGTLGWLYVVLAVVGMINAAIGGWYYLRLVAVMYLRDPVKPIQTPGTWNGWLALTVCVVLTVGLSVPPASNWLLGSTRTATTLPKSETPRVADNR